MSPRPPASQTITPSPAIAGIRPYVVPRHGAPLDLLLDGIGGLPTPPDLFDALRADDAERLVRHYPDTASLRAALAAEHGVAAEQVLVTGGGDDALDRCCRALLAPGRTLVLPEPTFEMIPRYAQWTGATILRLPWPGGDYPVDAVIAAASDATVVAVVSPNNPTGQVVTAEGLQRLSAALPHAVLMLDLAYVEFADVDLTPTALALPNVVVFRTLSKAWGMAGLRVGYAVGPAPIVGWMKAAGNPYTVAGPSVALAAAVRADPAARARVDAYTATVRGQRDTLAALLASLGAAPQRSQANFVFARTPLADWVRDGMAGLGIGVRGWPDHPTLGDAVRINVPGEGAVYDRAAHALSAVLAPEALLLDMDGVIADVSASYRAAIVQTAAGFGVTVTPDAIEAAKAAGDANNDWILTQRLLRGHGVDVGLDEVTAAFEALYQGSDAGTGLKHTERLIVPADVLRGLAARLPVAIVTGRPRRDAVEFLAQHDLADLTDVLVCMEDAPAKPSPAPTLAALAQLGVARAWLVGDTPDDVRSARAAGVVPLGVVAPGADPQRADAVLTAAGAARVLPDLTAVAGLLARVQEASP